MSKYSRHKPKHWGTSMSSSWRKNPCHFWCKLLYYSAYVSEHFKYLKSHLFSAWLAWSQVYEGKRHSLSPPLDLPPLNCRLETQTPLKMNDFFLVLMLLEGYWKRDRRSSIQLTNVFWWFMTLLSFFQTTRSMRLI